jgi:hypothetical protein
MAARFWVTTGTTGGTGNWSNAQNWSATSGGAAGASVPGSADTATFNASSGSGTATVDSNVTIQTLTMTGFTGSLAFGTNTISLNSTGLVFTGDSTYSVGGTPLIIVTNATATATTITPGTTVTEANAISFSFTAGTYGLSISNNSVVRSLNFTGFGGAFGSSPVNIYGDLTLSSVGTFSVTAGVGTLTFASTSATARTITCNGKTIDRPITFNGVSGVNYGTWQLADALLMGSTRALAHTNGTLDLNGKTLTAGSPYFTAAGTKVLTFNGGTLVCPAVTVTAFNNAAPTGFSTIAGTGTGKISMTGATAKSFVGGGSTFNCTLSNDGAGALTITGANTFTSIANGVSPTTFSFTAGTTTTVTTFNVNGSAALGNVIIQSATAAVHTLSQASGTVFAQYVTITNSTASGGATWYANFNSTNSGGNTGWIFGTTKYWVGGTGSWSTASMWSTSSGVPGSAGINIADKAVFNSLSGGGTSTVDSNVSIDGLTMTGYTGTLAYGTNSITLTGNGAVFTGGTTYSSSGTPVINISPTSSSLTVAKTVASGATTEVNSVSFNFTSGTYGLTFLATTFHNVKNIDFTGYSGTWAVRSSSSGNTIYGSVTLSSGMSFAAYVSGAITTFGATSGTKTITSNGKTFDFPTLINGIGGTFQLADAFAPRSLSIYNGVFNGNNKTISPASISLLLSIGDASLTTTTIQIGNVITASNVGATFFSGTCLLFGDCNIGSNVVLSVATLSLASYTFTCSTFDANNTSTRAINFGTGNITCTGSGNVWATAPTGLTVSGTPVVNISNNSATAATVSPGVLSEAQSISINFINGTYALSITASAAFLNLNFTGYAGTIANTGLTIYGDLNLGSTATLTPASGPWVFGSTNATVRSITSNARTFDTGFTFNGVNGSWQFIDNFTMGSSRILTHTNGTINLNGKALTVGARYLTATGTKVLTFNGGTLVCPSANTTSFNNAAPTNFSTLAGTGTGTINMTAATGKTFVGGGSTFNCTVSNGGAGLLTISGNNTISTVTTTSGSVAITGSNTITTISNSVQPVTFTFTASTTQTITNWNVNGTAGNLVTIVSSAAGTAASLSKSSGTVSADYLSIKDSTATGGAAWYAGANSVNVSGNSGWIFTAAPMSNGNFFLLF